jgi:hypothetical protein
MFDLKTATIPVAAAMFSLFTFVTDAEAASFLSCANATPDVSNGITISKGTIQGCAVLDGAGTSAIEPGDFDNFFLATINGLEGTSLTGLNWTGDKDGDKVEAFGTSTTDSLVVSNNGSGAFNEGGMWSISAAFFDTFKYALLIFKDGNAAPSPVITYLISEDASGGAMGTYDSSDLFFNAQNTNNSKDDAVSNVSVYGAIDAPTTTPVPLPAGLPLMLTVLGIGAFMRKRSQNRA